VVTEENHRVAERTEDEGTETTICSDANMLFLFPVSSASNWIDFTSLVNSASPRLIFVFLNYPAELFDSPFQPVLKISMRRTHGNGAAFCAAVVQSDLGEPD